MKKRLFVICLCLAGLNFLPVDTGLRFKGDWPQVPLHMNPGLPGIFPGTTPGFTDAVRTAIDLWSSSRTNVRLDVRMAGTSDRSSAYAPPALDCSAETEAALMQADNAVFVQPAETPDCTGTACTFVWSCADRPGIAHFDIAINPSANDVGPAATDVTLVNALSRSIGHVLGLDYCPPGELPLVCANRYSAESSEPPAGAIMHRVLHTDSPAAALHEDDAAGLRSLYSILTPEDIVRRNRAGEFVAHVSTLCEQSGCAIPDEETNPVYQLIPEERSNILEHDTLLLQNGYGERIERLGSFRYDQMLHDQALLQYEESAETILRNAMDKRAEIAARMQDDRLTAARHVITVQIKQKKAEIDEFGEEVDTAYRMFLEADLKGMILIRKAIIDEQNRR